MLRLVLDTNILISALLTTGTPPDMLYKAWKEGRFTLVTSEEQLSEVARVLAYPKLKPYITRSEAKELLIGLREHAVLVADLPVLTYSADQADNLILATAIKGRCRFLVTGDKRDLLSLQSIEGLSILTARAALDVLQKDL